MKVKTIVIWTLVNKKEHPLLTKSQMKISSLMPIVEKLFPGINYYSMTGFSQVMHECVIPALKKLHPELRKTPAEKITKTDTIKLTKLLPSDGYEWQDNPKWKKELNKALKAA